MTWHDLDMRTFHQWWKRQVRSGYSGSFAAPPAFRNTPLHPAWDTAALASAQPRSGMYAGAICSQSTTQGFGESSFAFAATR